ncbi:hypothetical protein CS0771_19330 [Catellatospora sp. IY07-71]|uniref:hypothetical protein n=1 Tax=Catellatospora sp. IY07-71 TaxID=2728827 RepID=UPI001BB305B0|nr:hypothetical protein [Catellatospora sp. IY07-71]BCJ72389.1 hypothetical protein CS0771_19330 [Catellatospora sp. IY07-71]
MSALRSPQTTPGRLARHTAALVLLGLPLLVLVRSGYPDTPWWLATAAAVCAAQFAALFAIDLEERFLARRQARITGVPVAPDEQPQGVYGLPRPWRIASEIITFLLCCPAVALYLAWSDTQPGTPSWVVMLASATVLGYAGRAADAGLVALATRLGANRR